MPFWACKDICKCIQNVEIWVLYIQERGRRCLKVDLCRPRALNICTWEHLMYVRQMCKQRAHNHIPRTCWPLWVAVAIYTPANLRACHHRKHYAKYAQKCQICAVWTNNIETGWMATSVRIWVLSSSSSPHYDGDDADWWSNYLDSSYDDNWQWRWWWRWPRGKCRWWRQLQSWWWRWWRSSDLISAVKGPSHPTQRRPLFPLAPCRNV